MTTPLRVNFVDESFNFNDLYRDDNWEPQTKEILGRFLFPESLFLDVGAWYGPVAMWAVRLGAAVIALEPDMDAYEKLLINVEGYPVTTIPTALSDHNGVSWLTNPRFFGDSQSRLHPSGGNDTQMVTTVTPETLLTGIDPALIKVDIEGHEQIIIEDLTMICRARSIPLLVAWHEPWWTRPRQRDSFWAQICGGFEIEGAIGGWGQTLFVPT